MEIKKNIQGRKPLSQKSKPAPFGDDEFGNPLSLDRAIIEAIEAKGLAYRFINSPQTMAMGGYHRWGWRPITLKELKGDQGANLNSNSLYFGNDPDGYVRRGDCVLAVRPKEVHEKHQQHLRTKAAEQTLSASDRASAEQLRRAAKAAGVVTTVEDGLGDEE